MPAQEDFLFAVNCGGARSGDDHAGGGNKDAKQGRQLERLGAMEEPGLVHPYANTGDGKASEMVRVAL